MSDKYEVGYKKPPVSGRFQKGSTGNPTGRRKGTLSPLALFKKIMNERITVREGGTTRRITRLEALFQLTLNKALSGDAKATAQFLALMKFFGSEITSDDEKELCGILRVPAKLSVEEWVKECSPLRDRSS